VEHEELTAQLQLQEEIIEVFAPILIPHSPTHPSGPEEKSTERQAQRGLCGGPSGSG
jgi:hypothetical protein